MSWDLTLPVGTEAISNGDNRIRELKVDLQTALRGNATDGDEAKFPGSDAANPVFRYRGLKGTTAARPATGEYGLYHNTTLNTIQRDNGVSWENVATLIPSGTIMNFFQAIPPVGWSALGGGGDALYNDITIRIVSVAGGQGGVAGGTTEFSACWGNAWTGAEAAHIHHIYGGTTGAVENSNGVGFGVSSTTHYHVFDVNSDAGSAHSHTVSTYAPKYLNVTIASKD